MCKPSGGIERFDDVPSLKDEGTANSRADLYKDGKLKQQRWYGPDGKAQRNRDYFHGGEKHNFPHDHPWDYSKHPARQECTEPDLNWV
ncbi:MAG: hypothetical protein PHS59_18310 [Paludibacter sp.]|nr:hypothetical protein [Paludibacter sp.]